MCRLFLCFAVLLIPASLHALIPSEKAQEQASAQVTVRARGPGCSVDLDDQRLGKTDDHGVLILPEVEPGDHYLHLRCPSEGEKAFFISPHSGEHVALDGNKAEEASNPDADAAPNLAEVKLLLRQLVQQAVQLRAQGKLDEAVERLRAA